MPLLAIHKESRTPTRTHKGGKEFFSNVFTLKNYQIERKSLIQDTIPSPDVKAAFLIHNVDLLFD